MSGYLDLPSPLTRRVPRPGRQPSEGGHSPADSDILVLQLSPSLRGANRADTELRAALDDLGAVSGSPALHTVWEPEMGANVLSRLSTQRDVARFFSQVRGSQFNSVGR